MNKDHIRRCFDSAAITYDQHAVAQSHAGLKLIKRLTCKTHNFDTIIDIGCGTGKLTNELTNHLKFKQLIVIDISDRMLDQAKIHLNNKPCHFITADFEKMDYTKYKPTLIFANYSLHWSNDLLNQLIKIINTLPKQSMFAFTLPLKNTFIELDVKNIFLNFNDIRSALSYLPIKLIWTHEETQRQAFISWKSAYVSIKKMGVYYVVNPSFESKKNLQFPNQPPFLTYQTGYFILKKL